MTCEAKLLTKEELEEAMEPLSADAESRVCGHIAALATEAAKVPGLEADNAAMLAAIRRWADDESDGDDAYEALLKVLRVEHPGATLLERLAKAESERDASRRLGAVLGVKLREVTKALGDEGSETPVALAEKVVAERDAAQQEGKMQHDRVEGLEKDRERIQDLLIDMVEKRKAAESEAESLRERVATLGAQVEELNGELAEVNAEARSINEMHDAEKARADTAEARVKELEAGLRALHDVACTIPTEHDDVRLDKAIAAARVVLTGSTSQPLPAPAQEETPEQESGSWESYPEDADVPAPEQGVDRERLGQEVREEWVAWAREQSNPKPSWLVPWEGLSEPDREVDRRIGERLFRIGQRATPTQPAPAQVDEESTSRELEAVREALDDAGVSPAGPEESQADRVDALARRPTPPALVEAVGEFFAALERAPKGVGGGIDQRRWWTARDALRAAYDAAKGGGR